ncbi:MAG: Pantoate--beta-alanine ligase [Acidimicrobiaceae bacterium]|nr:Pantoate--beta-alanine ligase [Acidimicrobiaceae bacterium]
MELLRTAAELAQAMADERRRHRRVGLVPTLGALHAGHRSLLIRAAAGCETRVLSIFVNPLQFGPGEDFAQYPRDLEGDLAVAGESGVTHVFAPEVSELYPPPVLTTVHVTGLAERLEGAFRPGHFDGVATVLTRLFNLVGPARAFFGEKDFQQLAVVRRVVTELRLPVEIEGCPTVREADGLALSSRNRRLSRPEREAAPVVYSALCAGANLVERGEGRPGAVRAEMERVIAQEPLAAFDYLEVVDPTSLEVPEAIIGPVRLLAAVRFGSVRLIDNLAAQSLSR